MALHTQLPIYKVTYDLLTMITMATKNMPRDFKAQIGGEIRKECVALVLLVYRANSATNKYPFLTELLERLQVAELLIRLSVDMHLISEGHYAKAISLTDQIGKQANGWRKKFSPAA